MRSRASVALFLALLAASAASAHRIEITPFFGGRFGGDFEEFQDGPYEQLELDDSSSYGLTIGFPVTANAEIELLWGRQSTQLVSGQFLEPKAALTDIDVDVFHVGGLYVFRDPAIDLRPFVSLSAGGTRFEPDGNLGSETKFSFGFGGGIKYSLGKNVGLRLQVRVIPTVLDEEDEVYCWYGCYVVEDTNWLTQTEISAGLILKF